MVEEPLPSFFAETTKDRLRRPVVEEGWVLAAAGMRPQLWEAAMGDWKNTERCAWGVETRDIGT